VSVISVTMKGRRVALRVMSSRSSFIKETKESKQKAEVQKGKETGKVQAHHEVANDSSKGGNIERDGRESPLK